MNRIETIRAELEAIRQAGEGGLTIEEGRISKREKGFNVARRSYYTGTDFEEVLNIVEKFFNIGVWYSGGVWYLDESIFIHDRMDAIINGILWHQLAVWNWSKFDEEQIFTDEAKRQQLTQLQAATN